MFRNFVKGFLFKLRFLCKSDLPISATKTIKKIGKINIFQARKTTISYTFLIEYRFEDYSCDSGILLLK